MTQTQFYLGRYPYYKIENKNLKFKHIVLFLHNIKIV